MGFNTKLKGGHLLSIKKLFIQKHFYFDTFLFLNILIFHTWIDQLKNYWFHRGKKKKRNCV